MPIVPVGFDYIQALLHIRNHRTYEEIAEFIGYDSKNSIARLLNGTVPAHPQGEAIFVLYRMIFGDKPPMNSQQKVGQFEQVAKYPL